MNLNLSIEKIAAITGAKIEAIDKNIVIQNIAALDAAGPQDLAVVLDRGDASVFDAISSEKIKQCNAAVILASKPIVPNKHYLLVNDALTAFTKLVAAVQKNINQSDTLQKTSTGALISEQATIAPTATIGAGSVICAGVAIGDNTIIEAQCYIGHHCAIGAQVIIHPGVKILDRCSIGDGSIIHSGAVIGSDGFGYEVTRQGLRKIPQIGTVVIGKMAEIGANCTIDRAAFDKTVIGNGVKMDNGIHIAHNVIIGDGTAILAQTGIAGSTKIGKGCQIGGQVAIKNDLVIGNGVKIVSKSAVMHNLKDGETVCGIPAISFMQWKRLQAMVNKLPEWSKLVGTFKDALQKKASLSIWQKLKHFMRG